MHSNRVRQTRRMHTCTHMHACLIKNKRCVSARARTKRVITTLWSCQRGESIDRFDRCDPPPPSLNHATMSLSDGSIRAISASSSLMCVVGGAVPYTFSVSLSLRSYDISNWLTLIRTMNAKSRRRRTDAVACRTAMYDADGRYAATIRRSDWTHGGVRVRRDKYQFCTSTILSGLLH